MRLALVSLQVLSLSALTLLAVSLLVLSLLVPAMAAPPSAASGSSVRGVDHVGLSVSDLAASESFFRDQLGFSVLRRDDEYPAVFLTNGDIIVTLWRVANPLEAVPFDRRRNVGLHHLAFQVESFPKLDALYERLVEAPGVRIEFAPEPLSGGPARHMMIREPSGNRLEFIHRPQSL
jgi:lactoylglutathione lyase